MPFVYALVGDELFLQLSAIRRISASLGAGVQRVDFDGESAALHEVFDELRSFSMFASIKLVVIRNAEDFISHHRDAMEQYVASPSDSATLVLRCSSLPGNQRISKLIAKHGSF